MGVHLTFTSRVKLQLRVWKTSGNKNVPYSVFICCFIQIADDVSTFTFNKNCFKVNPIQMYKKNVDIDPAGTGKGLKKLGLHSVNIVKLL